MSYDFGRQLAAARHRRGLKQQKLARRAGIPVTSISHFESGGRKPSLDNFRTLALALNVSADFLLGRNAFMERREDAAGGIADAYEKLSVDHQDLVAEFIKLLIRQRQRKEVGQ